MHGGSHRAQVAGATDACLHAWALHECVCVSAQCTPMQRRCTAWQGMGCEHGARAIYKRAVRWRKHSKRHQRQLLARLLHPMGWVLGLVHKCTTGCRLQARRLQQQAAEDQVCWPLQGPSALSKRALHCFLSPFARTGNPTSKL